ncbi:hypothetical protein CPB84DRAFT_68757 [Gymnopilus junonius]|uniref:Uncharacterized protein n=1 Tax=Gymnopilus junonius TaxID=109634 RepID=A0A9P5P3E7_GYMJU|nr:hypothetical protein CPB84DRAFT_68757 [Gymnopilus junonius]
MAESPRPRKNSLLSAESIASFDLFATQSPVTSDTSDIFHTPDLSKSDMDDSGSFLPNQTHVDSVEATHRRERRPHTVLQEALLGTEFKADIPFVEIDPAITEGIDPAKIVEGINDLPIQNAICETNLHSTNLSVEIDELVRALPECLLYTEEEPKLPSNISTEKLDAQLTSRLSLDNHGYNRCQLKCEDQSVNVDEQITARACSSESPATEPCNSKLQNKNVQSAPRHTPDRPNWALAPDDPPKLHSSSTSKGPQNERRFGGQRWRQSENNSRKNYSKTANLIQSVRRDASPMSFNTNSRRNTPGQLPSYVTMNRPEKRRGSALQGAAESSAVVAIREHHTSRADTDIGMEVTHKTEDTTQKKTIWDEVPPESQNDQHCSYWQSFSTSSDLHIENLRPTPASSSCDIAQAPYTSTEFSSWLASLEYECDKPIVLYQSSQNAARINEPELPQKSAGKNVGMPLKGNKAAMNGPPLQKPQFSPHAVPKTSPPKALNKISRTSLEDNMRLYAVDRARSSNNKKSSLQTVLLDDSGCLVSVSKIGHTAFADSTRSGHNTTASVHLPPKMPENNAGSVPPSHALTGREGFQADHRLRHVNKVDDALPWDPIHLSPFVSQEVSGREGRNFIPGWLDSQGPLPPWTSLLDRASQAQTLAQRDLRTSDGMNSISYSSHGNSSGSSQERLSPSPGHFVSPKVTAPVYHNPTYYSSANYTQTGTTPLPHDRLQIPSTSLYRPPVLAPLQSNRSFVTDFYDRKGEPGPSVILTNSSNSNGRFPASHAQGGSDHSNYNLG